MGHTPRSFPVRHRHLERSGRVCDHAVSQAEAPHVALMELLPRLLAANTGPAVVRYSQGVVPPTTDGQAPDSIETTLEGFCAAAHTHARWTVVVVMPNTAMPDAPDQPQSPHEPTRHGRTPESNAPGRGQPHR